MIILAFILLISGGLNWLSIGLLQYDFVAGFFGTQASILSRLVYITIGVACIYIMFDMLKNKGKLLLFKRHQKNKQNKEELSENEDILDQLYENDRNFDNVVNEDYNFENIFNHAGDNKMSNINDKPNKIGENKKDVFNMESSKKEIIAKENNNKEDDKIITNDMLFNKIPEDKIPGYIKKKEVQEDKVLEKVELDDLFK